MRPDVILLSEFQLMELLYSFDNNPSMEAVRMSPLNEDGAFASKSMYLKKRAIFGLSRVTFTSATRRLLSTLRGNAYLRSHELP